MNHDETVSAPPRAATAEGLSANTQTAAPPTQPASQIRALIEQSKRSEVVKALDDYFKRSIAANPDRCFLEIDESLGEPLDRIAETVSQALLTQSLFVRIVGQADLQDRAPAIRISLRLSKLDPMLNVRFVKYIWDGGTLVVPAAVALRVLALLECVPPLPRTLAILVAISSSCSNGAVRSKATLLAARAQADGRLVVNRLGDSDPRVRANAVEALWGIQTPAVQKIFREIVETPKEHHRILINALVGLYYAGHETEVLTRLQEIAAVPESSLLRDAASWAVHYLEEHVSAGIGGQKELPQSPEAPLAQ